jgi:hypothetical protein
MAYQEKREAVEGVDLARRGGRRRARTETTGNFMNVSDTRSQASTDVLVKSGATVASTLKSQMLRIDRGDVVLVDWPRQSVNCSVAR